MAELHSHHLTTNPIKIWWNLEIIIGINIVSDYNVAFVIEKAMSYSAQINWVIIEPIYNHIYNIFTCAICAKSRVFKNEILAHKWCSGPFG